MNIIRRIRDEDFLKEQSIYEEEGIAKLREDGEISDWEAGFMMGASGDGKGAKCRNCGKIFTDNEKVLERDIEGSRHIFCSDVCTDKFISKKKKNARRLFKNYE